MTITVLRLRNLATGSKLPIMKKASSLETLCLTLIQWQSTGKLALALQKTLEYLGDALHLTTADSVCAQEVILNGKFQNIQCLYEIFIEIRKRQIFSTTSVEELKSAKRTSSSSCKTTRLMASLFKAWNGICVKTKVSIMKSWKRISIFF